MSRKGCVNINGQTINWKPIPDLVFIIVQKYVEKNPGCNAHEVWEAFQKVMSNEERFLIKKEIFDLDPKKYNAGSRKRFWPDKTLRIAGEEFYITHELQPQSHGWSFLRTIAEGLGFTFEDWPEPLHREEKSSEKNAVVKEARPVRVEFTDELRSLNIPRTAGCMADLETWRVIYEETVPDSEKIPGLACYIEKQIKPIFGQLIRHFLPVELCPENLRVVLSPYRKIKIYSKGASPRDLLNLIEKYESLGVMAVPTTDLKEALTETKYSDIVTGEYNANLESPVITIYYRVLNTQTTKTYLAELSAVLAHEMYHFMHHRYAEKAYLRRSENREKVTEALADFFSVMYCLLRALEPNLGAEMEAYAHSRYGKWMERRDSVWPYAYALRFLVTKKGSLSYVSEFEKYIDFGCVEKARSVVQISKRNMEDAFKKLMEKPVMDVSSPGNAVVTLSHSNAGMQLIGIPQEKARRMTQDEMEDYLFPEDGHREKEYLAPMYMRDILKNNPGKRMGVGDVIKELKDPKYDLYLSETTARALLRTLALYEKKVWQLPEGRNLRFCYSEEKIQGYVTEDDINLS